jgi:predicted RNA-binding Zn ribbon-like protein
MRTLRHRDSPAEVEELADPVALVAWVTQFGPWDRVTATSDVRAVESARTLREAIFRVVDLARTTKGQVHPSDRDRIVINKAAGREVPIPSLDKRGEVQWAAPDPIAAVLATVARDALELVTSPTAARIRRCEGESCHAYFVDLSRR